MSFVLYINDHQKSVAICDPNNTTEMCSVVILCFENFCIGLLPCECDSESLTLESLNSGLPISL